ncbi:MAG TPA: hypothetical protein VLI93_08650 [Acetobacteraceae bacterium]|nr:hypothetical protein [Acetobacteraceae bacterium]
MTRRTSASLACLAAVYLYAASPAAAEVCRFTGTTNDGGQLAVTNMISANPADGTTMVDVIGRFRDTPIPFVHLNYMMEEISTWKAGQLRLLAVNTRYLVDGRIIRQLWDIFQPGPRGLEAYRIQAKTPDTLQREHPAFIRHFDPASFGQPWIDDFRSARPDRRADLDLPAAAMRPNLRPPLAMAFYWTRHMPPGGQSVTVFLPGFKRDKTASLTVAASGLPGDGWQRWDTSVRHPALDMAHASTASAWVSTDGRLLQLAGTFTTRHRTGSGIIREQVCNESAASP